MLKKTFLCRRGPRNLHFLPEGTEVELCQFQSNDLCEFFHNFQPTQPSHPVTNVHFISSNHLFQVALLDHFQENIVLVAPSIKLLKPRPHTERLCCIKHLQWLFCAFRQLPNAFYPPLCPAGLSHLLWCGGGGGLAPTRLRRVCDPGGPTYALSSTLSWPATPTQKQSTAHSDKGNRRRGLYKYLEAT